MAKKEKAEVMVDKKTKERLTQEIIAELEPDLKSRVCQSVMSSIEDSLNAEYKDNLKQRITEEIQDEIKDNIRASQAKLNRRKSFKIFRLSLYILILIVLSCYLMYRLYQTGNLELLKPDKYVRTTSLTTTTSVVKDYNYYMSNYGYLMRNIHITSPDLVTSNNNFALVDMPLKLAMAYKTLNAQDINVDGSIYTISEEVINSAYTKLFGTGYNVSNFTVDNKNFAYSSINKSYIAIVDDSQISNDEIYNSLIDIKEVNNSLIFTCIVALVKDNNIYNVNNLEDPLAAYIPGMNLDTMRESLSQVAYHFTYDGENYILEAISTL